MIWFFYTHVRWLTSGKALERVFNVREEIDISDNNFTIPEFKNKNEWLRDLAFLLTTCIV